MYHASFGLAESPFSIAVDPRYLYMSDRHRDALAHLLYGVSLSGGFILLSGEVGTGKTTIIRCLLEQLPETTDLALVLNPALDAKQLLATVSDELGIEDTGDDLKSLTDGLHRFLLDNHQRGRNTVLLIDEAQQLEASVLEQVRLLTNLETNTCKLLQIVLVGQPELTEKLDRPELRQLSQRITARCELRALDESEAAAYVEHRLRVAGLEGRQALFSPSILRKIYRASGGIPRVINIICDRALLGCYARRQNRVDRRVLHQALAEISGTSERRLSPHRRVERVYPLLLAGLVVFTLFALLWSVTAGVPSVDNAPVPPVVLAASPATVLAPKKAGPPTVAENPSRQLAHWWYQSSSEALSRLLVHGGRDVARDDEPCADGTAAGLRCEGMRVESWADLAGYRAPALLELEVVGESRWLVVLRVSEDSALLAGREEVRPWRQSELDGVWTGRVLMPWAAPPGYHHPLRRGSEGRVVSWLAEGFAQLDEQQRPLSIRVYNDLLERRVRLFQREQALTVDGVAGFRTLLRLQQLLAGHDDDEVIAAMFRQGG